MFPFSRIEPDDRKPGPYRTTIQTIQAAILVAVPSLYCLALFVLREDTPFFFRGLFDPSYAYYLNMVRVYAEFWPGIVEHPGIPLQMLGGLVLYISDILFPMPCDDFDCEVVYLLTHSEFYMGIVSAVLLAIFGIALAVFGFVVLSVTGSLGIAIGCQLFVGAIPTVIPGLIRLSPEALLVSIGLFIAALLLPLCHAKKRRLERLSALGALIAAAVFTKFTALPYMLLALGACGRHKLVRFVLVFAGMALLWSTLLYPQLDKFTSFYKRFFHGSGNYGYGGKGAPTAEQLVDNFITLVPMMTVEMAAVLVLTIAAGYIAFKEKYVPTIVVLALGLCPLVFLVMSRQPVPRYFVPMVPLLALVTGWVFARWEYSIRGGWFQKGLLHICFPIAMIAWVLISYAAAKAQLEVSQGVVNMRNKYDEEIAKLGDCYVMRPYDQLTGIYFGKNWARSYYIDRLMNTQHKDFVIYNHNGRRELFNFSGQLSEDGVINVQEIRGKRLCAVFNDRDTYWGIDDEYFEVLDHRHPNWTAVRVREASNR